MGSSPSKVVKRVEQGQVDNHIEESDSDFKPSFDDSAYSKEQHSEEKKEMETISSLSATPRTKVKGADGQNRGSRQVKEGRDDDSRRARITDEQVHVNLAMADLMAYLQVVANNSNNLPLTRRDDPELSRIVSNLTSEEYARKSAAFIPADVRLIGGSFTKYGRVWDLPTSEEYNAQDGAQEPGELYIPIRPSFRDASPHFFQLYRSILWRRLLQCHVEGALRCSKRGSGCSTGHGGLRCFV